MDPFGKVDHRIRDCSLSEDGRDRLITRNLCFNTPLNLGLGFKLVCSFASRSKCSEEIYHLLVAGATPWLCFAPLSTRLYKLLPWRRDCETPIRHTPSPHSSNLLAIGFHADSSLHLGPLCSPSRHSIRSRCEPRFTRLRGPYLVNHGFPGQGEVHIPSLRCADRRPYQGFRNCRKVHLFLNEKPLDVFADFYYYLFSGILPPAEPLSGPSPSPGTPLSSSGSFDQFCFPPYLSFSCSPESRPGS